MGGDRSAPWPCALEPSALSPSSGASRHLLPEGEGVSCALARLRMLPDTPPSATAGGGWRGASTTAHLRAKPLPLRSGGRLGGGHRAVARHGVGCDCQNAPIPAFPRKRGKGFRARTRGFGCPPSQPSPASGGRGFVRVRAASDAPHPSLPPPAGEGVSCAYARLRMPPIPAFPRQRGKGLRARTRGFGWPPSQPSPASGGRGFVRVRAASDGPHPSLPP
jgi:hypothetical protein